MHYNIITIHMIFQTLSYYEFDMQDINAPSSLYVSSYIYFFPQIAGISGICH